MNLLNRRLSFKHAAFSLLIGSGAGLGALFPILLLLMPAFLGFVGAAWGMLSLALSLAAAAAALFALMGDAVAALYAIAALLPASIILAFVLGGKRPYRYAVIWMSAVFALFGYALLCLPSMLAGGGPFDAAIATVNAEVERLLPLVPQLFSSAQQAQLVETYLLTALEIVPEAVVALIFGFAEFFALLDTLLARMLLKRAKVQTRPMAPLVAWQLPKDFLWGALVLTAGAFLCVAAELNNASAIVVAAESIAVPPFALMGLAFFEFSNLVSPRRGGAWRAFTYVALVLLFPSSLFVLAGFGVLDRAMRIRSRMIRKK